MNKKIIKRIPLLLIAAIVTSYQLVSIHAYENEVTILNTPETTDDDLLDDFDSNIIFENNIEDDILQLENSSSLDITIFSKEDLTTKNTFSLSDSAIIDAGTWGSTNWVLYNNGSLEISNGVGAYYNSHLLPLPWNTYKTEITKVTITNVIAPSSLDGFFYDYTNLQSTQFDNFDTLNVQNMSYMFYNCNSLTTLDVSSFNTANVSNMSFMFSGCNSLTTLDIYNFNTANVSNMSFMFSGCNSLTTLDIYNLNTTNVSDMSGMFSGCNSLTTLDLSNFSTTDVINMRTMFYGCSNLTTLDTSSFHTDKVQNMAWMFSGCESLTTLNLDNFSTINVQDVSYMFYGCFLLTTLDLSMFATNNVQNMTWMFAQCRNLATLDIQGFSTDKVRDMSRMFYGCGSLDTLDLSTFSTNNVQDMSYMFYGASVYRLDLGANFKFGNLVSLYYLPETLYWMDLHGQRLFTSDSLIEFHNQSNKNNTYQLAIDMEIHYITLSNEKIHESQIVSAYIGKPYDFTGDEYQLILDGYILNADYFPMNAQGIASSYQWTDIYYIYNKQSQLAINVFDSILYVGDSWQAEDNFDSAIDHNGNLISFNEITVDGNVNTSVPGVYEISYQYDGITSMATVLVKDKEASNDKNNILPDEDTKTIVPKTTDILVHKGILFFFGEVVSLLGLLFIKKGYHK